MFKVKASTTLELANWPHKLIQRQEEGVKIKVSKKRRYLSNQVAHLDQEFTPPRTTATKAKASLNQVKVQDHSKLKAQTLGHLGL